MSCMMNPCHLPSAICLWLHDADERAGVRPEWKTRQMGMQRWQEVGSRSARYPWDLTIHARNTIVSMIQVRMDAMLTAKTNTRAHKPEKRNPTFRDHYV